MSESSRATRHMLKATYDGNLEDYNKWVSRGADIAGTDKKGQNALHFLVKQGKFPTLQQILISRPEVHHLVNKVDNKGWSPLHLCCIQHPVELRTLESLLTIGGNPNMENKCGTCKDLVDNDAKEFLHWRKRHQNGLPRDIKILPNEYIVNYMRKFGHLGDDFTVTYDRILEEGQVTLINIQIIVTGTKGVGKTSLLQSMMGLKVKKNGQIPTKGIQMFHRRFTIDVMDDSRTDNGEESEYAIGLQQFVDSVLKKMQVSEPSRSESTWLKRHLSTSAGTRKEGVMSKRGSSSSEKAILSILDFSGDEVYENIQHLFMTSHGVYILVFSLQSYPQLVQMLDDVYTRLRYISLYDKSNSQPAIILVGTNLDRVPDSSTKYKSMQTEIWEHLREHSELGKFVREHVHGMFLVNNLDLLQGVRDRIWQTIVNAAMRGQKCQQDILARWLALEREVFRYNASGHRVMTFGDLCTVAKEMAVPIHNDDQVKDFLRFMCQKKSILICNKLSSITSHDPIVVNTKWLVNRVVELLKVQQPYVSPEFVESFMECETKGETTKTKRSFMTAISRLFLIAEPLPEKTKNKTSCYVLTSMLPPVNDQLMVSSLNEMNKISTLCFISKEHFIPSAVRDKLLTMCINRFEVLSDPVSQKRLLYRCNGGFVVNPGVTFALQSNNSTVKVALFSCQDSVIYAGIGGIIREALEDLLDDRSKYECHLLYEDGSREIFLQVSDEGLMNPKTVSPHQDPSQDVAIWFGKIQQKSDVNMDVLKQRQDFELSPRRLSHVAKHIGNSYAVVFASLGLEATVVEKERYQHKNLDLRSQLTKVLLRWRAMQKGAASLKKIVEAMKMNCIPYEEMLLDPVWTGDTTVKDIDTTVVPGIDLSSSPTSDDLAVIAGIVGSSFLVFFLDLEVDYLDIQKAMELHRRQSEKALAMYLLEVWGQRFGSKATFYCIICAMNETNLDTSQLKLINPRSSHC